MSTKLVLNLIINGLPSKHTLYDTFCMTLEHAVLNLIINGLPSKLPYKRCPKYFIMGFKPYYKWITF